MMGETSDVMRGAESRNSTEGNEGNGERHESHELPRIWREEGQRQNDGGQIMGDPWQSGKAGRLNGGRVAAAGAECGMGDRTWEEWEEWELMSRGPDISRYEGNDNGAPREGTRPTDLLSPLL